MERYLKSSEDGQPRVYEIAELCQYIEVARWLYTDDQVLFRGQTFDWPLKPSIGRVPDESQFLRCERKMLDEFKREAIPYIDVVPANDWQWLALAQHNRLPTRLLDWTTNPLVALWFAVSAPAVDDEPGVAWAFQCSDEDAIPRTDEKNQFRNDKMRVYFPEHVFPSIQAQSGRFTVHPRHSHPLRFPDMSEVLDDADKRLTKIEIVPTSFPTICFELRRLGVHAASLFPGLEGLAARIRYDRWLPQDEGQGADGAPPRSNEPPAAKET